ncbi:hypothetical protein HPB52_022878 [Rhipicephalus sanguineus]|uniref:Uncharacterized protein n=1 Tax=Rhipicephalus sanguineus TaxID=34632 RepID=A0A9D4Q3J8_RHISA|nr:hypothetical protein HPB52_022878 [Rhipicephalus sanguineus]
MTTRPLWKKAAVTKKLSSAHRYVENLQSTGDCWTGMLKSNDALQKMERELLTLGVSFKTTSSKHHSEHCQAGSAQDSCDVDVDGAEELMPVALRDTLRGVRFADYVEVDTGASVCGALTDEDIIAQVAGAQPVAEGPEGEEDEDDEAPVRPSASAVMEALNVARLFFSFEEGEEDSLRRVRALEQRAAAVAFREKKQMVITDFFGQ